MRSVALPLAVLASGVASLAEAIDIALERCDTNEPIDHTKVPSEVDIFTVGCVDNESGSGYVRIELDDTLNVYKMTTSSDGDCTTDNTNEDPVSFASSEDGTKCSSGDSGNGYTHNLVSANFLSFDELIATGEYLVAEAQHSGNTNCSSDKVTSYIRYHKALIDDIANCFSNKRITVEKEAGVNDKYTVTSYTDITCGSEDSSQSPITFSHQSCNNDGTDSQKYYDIGGTPSQAPTVGPTPSPTVGPTDAPTAAPRVALEKCVGNEPISQGEAYSEVDIFVLDTCVDVTDGGGATTSSQYQLDAAVYKKFTYTNAGCVGTDLDATVPLASNDVNTDCSATNTYTHNLVIADFTDPMELVSASYTIVEGFHGPADTNCDTPSTTYTRYHVNDTNTCVKGQNLTYTESGGVTTTYTLTSFADAPECTGATTEKTFVIDDSCQADADPAEAHMMYYEYVAPTPTPASTNAPTTTTEYAVFHECDGDDLTENPQKLIVRALDTCQGSGSTFTKLVLVNGSYMEETHTSDACNDTTPSSDPFFSKDGTCAENDQVLVDTNLDKPATADYPVAVLTYSGDNCATNGVVKSLDLYHSNFTTIGNCTNKVKLEVDGTKYNITTYSDNECQNGADPIVYEMDVCLNGTAPSSKLVVYSDEHDDHGDHASGSGHVALSTFSLILIAAATLL